MLPALIVATIFFVVTAQNAITVPRTKAARGGPFWRQCIQRTNPGRPFIFHVTKDVQCPCLVRFEISRTLATPAKPPKFDFLIVPAKEVANRTNKGTRVHFVPRYSIIGARATQPAEGGGFKYESQGFEIGDSRKFALMMRYESSQTDCYHEVRWVMERVPRRCPIRLQKPLSARVVGGTDADTRTRKLAVSFVRSDKLICSGSLIAPLWVLTAAHCSIRNTDVAYVAGVDGYSGSPRRILRKIVHPRFNSGQKTGPHDIALVQLSGAPISGVAPVVLNSRPAYPSDLSIVRVVGYGRLFEDFSSARAPPLRTVDLPVFPMPTCMSKISTGRSNLRFPLNGNVQLCAGYEDGACDSCQGDSGGPALAYDGTGNPVQLALVSFGFGCARLGTPAVYTRVQPYLNWIRSVVPEVKLSDKAIDVKAENLKSGTLPYAEFAGTGTDGLQPQGSDGFKGDDGLVAKWLKFAIPASLGAMALLCSILACCCSVCVLRMREKRTLSDIATGKFTLSIRGPKTELGYSLGHDDEFGNSETSTPTKPPRVAIKLPRRKRLFGKRTKSETVVIPNELTNDTLLSSNEGSPSGEENADQSHGPILPPAPDSRHSSGSQQRRRSSGAMNPGIQLPPPSTARRLEDEVGNYAQEDRAKKVSPLPSFPPRQNNQPNPQFVPPPSILSQRKSVESKNSSTTKKKRRSMPQPERRVRIGDGVPLPPAPLERRMTRMYNECIPEERVGPNSEELFSEEMDVRTAKRYSVPPKRRSLPEQVRVPNRSSVPPNRQPILEGKSTRPKRRSMPEGEPIMHGRLPTEILVAPKHRSMPTSQQVRRAPERPPSSREQMKDQDDLVEHNTAMMVLGSLGMQEVEPEKQKSYPFLQPPSRR